jgi:hypothetical protein
VNIVTYQSLIILTIVMVRLFAKSHFLNICIFWTLFTLINVFWAPLLILQLVTVWSTYRFILFLAPVGETRGTLQREAVAAQPARPAAVAKDAAAPLQPAARQWYYKAKGVLRGPYDDEELRSFLISGLIDRNTLVWTQATADWRPVAQSDLIQAMAQPARSEVPPDRLTPLQRALQPLLQPRHPTPAAPSNVTSVTSVSQAAPSLVEEIGGCDEHREAAVPGDATGCARPLPAASQTEAHLPGADEGAASGGLRGLGGYRFYETRWLSRWLAILSGMAALTALTEIATLFYAMSGPSGVAAQGARLTAVQVYDGLNQATIFYLVPIAILYLTWIYRCTSNDWAIHGKAPYSPGMAVASHFIPILCLWRPCVSVVRISALHGARSHGLLIALWWTTWLVGGFIHMKAAGIAAQTPAALTHHVVGWLGNWFLMISCLALAWIIARFGDRPRPALEAEPAPGHLPH